MFYAFGKNTRDFNHGIKRYLWEGNLWNPSYFVATVSENTEEQIRNYIQ
ncbi:transposase, partial [Clostridium perfringens]